MDKNKMKKILFINFITMATFNMAHPVTPSLINALSMPTYMFGVLYSTMSIAHFVMSPIWGSMSDQKGRKRFLVIGVIGYGLSQLGFGFIESTPLILLFRIAGGAMSVAFITTCIAYVSDISSKEERTKYMSYHTATTSIASSAGALIGGFCGGYGYKVAFLTQRRSRCPLPLLRHPPCTAAATGAKCGSRWLPAGPYGRTETHRRSRTGSFSFPGRRFQTLLCRQTPQHLPGSPAARHPVCRSVPAASWHTSQWPCR